MPRPAPRGGDGKAGKANVLVPAEAARQVARQAGGDHEIGGAKSAAAMNRGTTVGGDNQRRFHWNCHMTIARKKREDNRREAFELMMKELGDRAIDTTLFDSEQTV